MIKRFFGVLAAALALSGPAAAEIPDYIKNAVNNPERPADDVMRDAQRKPGEVLSFIGFKPGMKIADLMAGRGYYTEIIRHVVGAQGHVTAHNNFYIRGRFMDTFKPEGPWETKLASESWKKNVSGLYSRLDEPKLPAGLDGALMVLFYHDTVWLGTDRAKMNKAVFEALKPGGVYAIIDHSGEKGSGVRDVKTLHRIDRDVVIGEVEAAGFKLAGSSDLLSHPEDSRDYNVFRDVRTRRDQTDRFVLKFVKP